MNIDPIFYRNPTSALGFSLDEGESLHLPSGKVLRPIPKVWEECDPADEELSDVQRETLQAHRDKPQMTDLEEMAWKLRKGQLADARDYVRPRVAVGDPSVDRPDHDAIYRRLQARDALVVKSDLDD